MKMTQEHFQKMGNKAIWEDLQQKVKPEFLAICYTGEEHD